MDTLNQQMIKPITKGNRDYAISMIRLIATIFLIICHIMQYYEMELRVWFNVCVQMFLCISGFLYGQKTIKSKGEFYRKSASKILIDYYIIFFIVLGLHYLLIPNLVRNVDIFKGVFIHEGGPLIGGGHLWFVSYILFLYFITPLFQMIYESSFEKQGEKGVLKTTFVILAANYIIFYLYIPYFKSAWIACYVLGYMLGFLKKRQCKSIKLVVWIISLVAFVMNALRIYFDYIIKKSFVGGRFESLYDSFYHYAHAMLGVALCCVLYVIFSKLFSGGGKLFQKILNISDYLSYDIYLTHQFFIRQPFSVMEITGSSFLNILLVFVLSIMSAYILKILSSFVRKIMRI